jgi:transcriptional regulator with XRE-family HTH domain
MALTRRLGLRRTMTPNQIVAYNLAKARALRGWTQEEAAEQLAPYWGARLSGASFSALERSAWSVERIKQFSADDLLALARCFDVPLGYFFTPPPPGFDAALHTPDAPTAGVDPIVLLDAVLGSPNSLAEWETELLAYSASHAPAPTNRRVKAPVSPKDLADRLAPLGQLHGRALLRQTFGELSDAGDVLVRIADALRTLDTAAADDTTPAGTKHDPDKAERANQARERALRSAPNAKRRDKVQ